VEGTVGSRELRGKLPVPIETVNEVSAHGPARPSWVPLPNGLCNQSVLALDLLQVGLSCRSGRDLRAHVLAGNDVSVPLSNVSRAVIAI
jgi:hypothetical protein